MVIEDAIKSRVPLHLFAENHGEQGQSDSPIIIIIDRDYRLIMDKNNFSFDM